MSVRAFIRSRIAPEALLSRATSIAPKTVMHMSEEILFGAPASLFASPARQP
jgi:hypothetical protein